MYFNTQQDIITGLSKSLERKLPMKKKAIETMISIAIGIILSGTTITSKIAEKLKENFSKGKEESKIKKIKRFLSTKLEEEIYIVFVEEILKTFKAEKNKVVIIIDHTTCEDRFVILNMVLSIGKRGIRIYYKIYEYEDEKNKSMEDVEEGLRRIKKILIPYGYEVTVLGDRGFGSTELFKKIEEMGWEYYIRVKGNYTVKIGEDEVIGKLEEIEHPRGQGRYFEGVELTQNKHKCNIASKPSREGEDTWYIATNGEARKAINNYKRRFSIEEIFKDMKSNGLGMEDNWIKKVEHYKNMYLCVCVAYVYIIVLGSDCTRNKKNKELGSHRKTEKANKGRVYSIFRIGLKWFNRKYFSREEEKIRYNFLLYDI